MQKWEYKIIDIWEFNSKKALVDKLTKMGEDGWELVAVHERGDQYHYLK